MWPSRCSLRGRLNRGRGGEGPELPHFFSLPSLPLPFPDVFYESLFFRNKMASPVKRSRRVALSAERVLQSLEQKGDGMSSGEESDLYRQLQDTSDIYRSRYKLSCVTVLLRKHTMRFTFRSFYSLVLAIQSTTVTELTSLEFINFNRNGIRLPREALSISKAKTLKLYAMNRREENLSVYMSVFYSVFCTYLTFEVFQPFILHLFITSTLKIRKFYIVFYLLSFF